MAKENYELKENPGYQTVIRSWKNEDPVNAEEIMNPVVETALNNTHAVKLSVDQHRDDSTKHITTVERKKLNDIDEGANKYVHPNSGVNAGTYRSVTVNAAGHITSGSNPTTIFGYGLTDVYTKTESDTKLNAKANASSLTEHTGNTTIHITSTERTNWNDANNKKHEHNNKTVIDGITSSKVSGWDNASANNHTHSNKSVLDGISSTKISNWDTASSNNHTHSNKSALDGITSTKITNWDSAASNAHTHSNKSILDSVSQTKVTTWDGYDQKITNLNTTLKSETDDSGWIELNLESGFIAYVTLGYKPRIRKIGKNVVLHGVVSPPTDNTLAGTGDGARMTICTLPQGYRPEYTVTVLCQGTTRAIWLLNITPEGRVTAGRYRTENGSVTPLNTYYMPFHTSYFVAK